MGLHPHLPICLTCRQSPLQQAEIEAKDGDTLSNSIVLVA